MITVDMTATWYALVMIFGAIVASIGLVPLFRKHERSLGRIKIFGREFQFSAPGLVVILRVHLIWLKQSEDLRPTMLALSSFPAH